MLQLTRPDDRERIEVLAQQIHGLHVQMLPDVYKLASEMWTQERYDEAIAQRQLFAAKLDDQIVGYALVRVRDYDGNGLVKHSALMIEEICVDEPMRYHGIGSQIMTDIRAIAKAYGCDKLLLGVYPENVGAIAFYQKCGFSIRSINMQMMP